MELFKQPTIDWLGKKWYFIIGSFLLSLIGILSLVFQGGPRYGIDFRGGTQVSIKFRETPELERLRAALESEGLQGSTLQRIGAEAENEILVAIDMQGADEESLNASRSAILSALRLEFGGGDQLNFNEASVQTITDRLASSSAVVSANLPREEIRQFAERLVEFRSGPANDGLVAGFDDLSQVEGFTPVMRAGLEDSFAVFPFVVRNVEIVGPKVGAALRRQALNATLLGMAAMLVYIAFRFEWIFGVAAVLAILHDVIIAIGFLSIVGMEVSITVIAALLTLVGYSVNDTIVVFDRIRENLKLNRRDNIATIANQSINQTLSRTILTSGLTFLTVLSLFLFGGDVLRVFSFTLVVGIIVGSYSSISVASTVVVSWIDFSTRHRRKGLTREADRGRIQRTGADARAKA